MQPSPVIRVGQYDPSLGRTRTHSDDFYDHRKLVLDHIREAIAREKQPKRKR